MLDLLKGGVINCLLIEKGAGFEAVAARARQQGLTVADPADAIAGVTVIKGEWPGVQLSEGGSDQASAGPTGEPWVDSNGWQIRLAAALQPGTAVWVSAAPKDGHARPEAHVMALADAAAYGGRWIVTLDSDLAKGIEARNPPALEAWKKISGAASFFDAHKAWLDYAPQAVLGVVSDFSGQDEFLSHELLNLVARTNQQYRIVVKSKVSAASFSGLRAVLYTDAQPPEAGLRQQILGFVEAGGMLITGHQWGDSGGAPARGEDHPRYDLRVLGKGRLAMAKAAFDDPYVIAQDAVVLMSHRYELLRFWNPGALGSYLTAAPDGKRTLAQMLFYTASQEGPTSVRVVGRYRTARLWTLDRPAARGVETIAQKDAVELHMPAVTVYAAVELE